ncbi:GAD-like domain-containing protein [Oceanicola sp. D3]|uniref:GAD-like domain-containing protein n=1 Tax=Oceanicola sp. D3 TaxID=2587163 RepID=UPI00111ED251|nr:GAD-like domain-containing protein [Oceanicola sp. D3]QDC09482.1 GAD-like domain-containing protein [Oceanicola sp. D3]
MSGRSELPGAAEELAALIEARGPLEMRAPVTAAEITLHEGRVAPILLDLWEDHGVGDLADGGLRLCVPGELRSAVDKLFSGDPDFSLPEERRVDVHAFAHTAFGNLFLWSERHWLIYVDVVQGLVEAPFLHRPESRRQPDRVALDWGLAAEGPLLDMVDSGGQPMLERAQEAFDPLPRMVIYAPGAAASAEPIPDFEDLYAAHYPEWLEERAASKVWYLSDMATRRFNIREIGAAA